MQKNLQTEITIRLKAFDQASLEQALRKIQQLFDNPLASEAKWSSGERFSKVSLPTTTRTFTLLRSPHGHSKSREQFSLSSQKAIISLRPPSQPHAWENKSPLETISFPDLKHPPDLKHSPDLKHPPDLKDPPDLKSPPEIKDPPDLSRTRTRSLCQNTALRSDSPNRIQSADSSSAKMDSDSESELSPSRNQNASVVPLLYALMATPFYGVKLQISCTQTVSAKTLLWR
jgi:ribosomal protein S10